MTKGLPARLIKRLSDNGNSNTTAETRSFAKQLGLKPVTAPVANPQSYSGKKSAVNETYRQY